MKHLNRIELTGRVLSTVEATLEALKKIKKQTVRWDVNFKNK